MTQYPEHIPTTHHPSTDAWFIRLFPCGGILLGINRPPRACVVNGIACGVKSGGSAIAGPSAARFCKWFPGHILQYLYRRGSTRPHARSDGCPLCLLGQISGVSSAPWWTIRPKNEWTVCPIAFRCLAYTSSRLFSSSPCFCSGSPGWLLHQGKEQAGRKALAKLRGRNYATLLAPSFFYFLSADVRIDHRLSEH